MEGHRGLTLSSMGQVWSKVGLSVVSCSTYRMENLSLLLLFLLFPVPGLLGSSRALCSMDEVMDEKMKQGFSSLCEEPFPQPC